MKTLDLIFGIAFAILTLLALIMFIIIHSFDLLCVGGVCGIVAYIALREYKELKMKEDGK